MRCWWFNQNSRLVNFDRVESSHFPLMMVMSNQTRLCCRNEHEPFTVSFEWMQYYKTTRNANKKWNASITMTHPQRLPEPNLHGFRMAWIGIRAINICSRRTLATIKSLCFAVVLDTCLFLLYVPSWAMEHAKCRAFITLWCISCTIVNIVNNSLAIICLITITKRVCVLVTFDWFCMPLHRNDANSKSKWMEPISHISHQRFTVKRRHCECNCTLVRCGSVRHAHPTSVKRVADSMKCIECRW